MELVGGARPALVRAAFVSSESIMAEFGGKGKGKVRETLSVEREAGKGWWTWLRRRYQDILCGKPSPNAALRSASLRTGFEAATRPYL